MPSPNRARGTFLRILLSHAITVSVLLSMLRHIGTSEEDGVSVGSSPLRQHSCSQTTYRMLADLTSRINKNTNANALIPLRYQSPASATTFAASGNEKNDTNGNTDIAMPGLELSSFYGKRIALFGDSTLYLPTKYLVSMLRHQDKVGSKVNYGNFTLGEANAFVLANLEDTSDVPAYKTGHGRTWIQWWGMGGHTHGRTGELMDAMFEDSKSMRPEVVVANMALHWLQLCNYSNNYMCPAADDVSIVDRWLHYKKSWLQRVYDYATEVDAKLLLFKTANFVCGSARTGTWARGTALYRRFDDATLDACTRRVYPFAKELSLSRNDTYKFCKYGQFTEVGVRYLNERTAEFVRDLQQRDGARLGSNRPIVGVFDDHALQDCSTTVKYDAIHHKRAIPMRLRLLSNAIDSYLKCARN